MNKKLWLILLVGYLMDAQPIAITHIDPKTIINARDIVKNSLDRRYKKRLLTTCLLGAAGAASIYGLVRVFKSLPPAYSAAAVSTAGNVVDKNGVVQKVSVGWFKWAYQGLKDNCVSFVYQTPTMLFFTGFSALIGRPLTKSINSAMSFYQSLNWSWFIRTHVKVPYLFKQLKYNAARLDGKSAIFDQLSDVTINWDAHPLVKCNKVYTPLSIFDELVQLKALSRVTCDKDATKEALARTWNEIVRGLIFCLGFIEYQLEISDSDNSFDKNQLDMFKKDAIQRTNEVAEKLAKLLAQDSQEGLLATTYEYCTFIEHLILNLRINDIVEG